MPLRIPMIPCHICRWHVIIQNVRQKLTALGVLTLILIINPYLVHLHFSSPRVPAARQGTHHSYRGLSLQVVGQKAKIIMQNTYLIFYMLNCSNKTSKHNNPCCAEFIYGNMKICLHLLSFLSTDLSLAVEILPHGRQRPINSTYR